MRSRRLVPLALAVATLVGACGHNKRATKTVTSRAAFELSCPEDQLELTVLESDGPRKLAKQIGVKGCGQKMVYVYFSSNDTWVASSAVTPTMIERQADYEEQKAREDRLREEQRRLQEQGTYQRGVGE